MNMIKKHKTIFLLVLLFIILFSIYFIREFIASRDIYTESYGEDYIMNPKTYGVNEYSIVNITEEQMANIYLNNFKSYLINDVNYAYQLLNEEYRNKKFGNINNFIDYVNTVNKNSMVLDKYSIIDGQNKLYMLYTKDNKVYIFKIISVMEYEVYLDDYTVEI